MGNAKGYILAIALPSHIHTSLYLCHEESEDFSKPKIIWGEISDKSKFAFDFLGEYIPEATSFYMKGECIEYLLSALNSSVSEWLFSKVGTTTGVGTIRWKKYTIEQLIGKHSKKCTFYTLRFGCSFAAVNTIKPQLL